MTNMRADNASDEIAKRRPRKRFGISMAAAATVMILGLGLVYLYSFSDPGGSHQISLREKFSVFGDKLSASAFAKDQLDLYCFEPFSSPIEIANELRKDSRFSRGELSDRAETGFSFVIFSGAGGSKYAMVRELHYQWTNPERGARRAVPNCLPINSVTIELKQNLRERKSKRGIEEISVVITVDNK